MRRTLPFLTPQALVILAIVFSIGAYLLQQSEPTFLPVSEQKLTFNTADIPNITASSFLVFDMKTGAVLTKRSETKVLSIASVTKLFTAATLLSDFDLAATTTVTWSDIATEGESGKLKFDQIYTYRDLLFPLLLESSNDAATVLARATDGTLLEQMNDWAKALGVASTTFSDTSGLSDANVSTAADLKILLTNTYKNTPHIFDITRLKQYIGPYTGWRNNNPVVNEPGYLGGKHGYTVAAGRTLVAVFDEDINGHTYTIGYIILGSADIKADVGILRQFINNSASAH